MQYSPHLPVAYIDTDRIARNFRLLLRASAAAQAKPEAPFCQARKIPPHFGGDAEGVFVWPSQLAVVKADAYGHGHIKTAAALLREGATLLASGCVQEAVALRRGLAEVQAEERLPAQVPVILSLLGLVSREDVFLCADNGIIPVVHSFEQLGMLQGTERHLPVALKCNTGMNRLGFNEPDLPALVEFLKKIPGVKPVIALSHLHSADTEKGREECAVQARLFNRMLGTLRSAWPDLAASLGNSAGTLLAGELAGVIGPHVCRPGVALYGTNPFIGTSLAPLGDGLVPAMSVSAPLIAVREVGAGSGVGYGHTFIADRDMPLGIMAAGYADCYSRGLSNKASVCVSGYRAPVVGRVSMQMTAVDLSALPLVEGKKRPDTAWILGGPHDNAVSAEELARVWDTITYEVFCLLGYNNRVYGPYPTA